MTIMKSYLNECERWLHRFEYVEDRGGISYWKCRLCAMERSQYEDLQGG